MGQDHSSDRRPSAATAALLLLLGGGLGLCLGVALGLWVGHEVLTTSLWRVESVVAPVVVAAGAVAAAWVGASALVAGACALVRASGGAWHAGEAAVHRWAPGAVRRTLAIAVAAGLGLTSAAAAQAEAPAPPPATVVDLGWIPTSEHVPGGTARSDTSGATAEDDARTEETRRVRTDQVTADPHPAAPVTALAPAVSDGTTGPAAPAVGDETVGDPHASHPVGAAAGTRELPGPPEPRAGAGRAAPAPTPGTVTVSRGDTLWSLVAHHLGPEATDAEIAAAWPRWYAANAAVIGPDPDLVLPGQVLEVPTGADL